MSWFTVSVERNIASAVVADATRVTVVADATHAAVVADATHAAIAAEAALSCSCLSSMCCCRVG